MKRKIILGIFSLFLVTSLVNASFNNNYDRNNDDDYNPQNNQSITNLFLAYGLFSDLKNTAQNNNNNNNNNNFPAQPTTPPTTPAIEKEIFPKVDTNFFERSNNNIAGQSPVLTNNSFRIGYRNNSPSIISERGNSQFITDITSSRSPSQYLHQTNQYSLSPSQNRDATPLRPLELIALHGIEENASISPSHSSKSSNDDDDEINNSNNVFPSNQPQFPEMSSQNINEKLHQILYGDIETTPQSEINTPSLTTIRSRPPVTRNELMQNYLRTQFADYVRTTEESLQQYKKTKESTLTNAVARNQSIFDYPRQEFESFIRATEEKFQLYKQTKESIVNHCKRGVSPSPENESLGKREQNYQNASSLVKNLMGKKLNELTPNELQRLDDIIQELKGLNNLYYQEHRETLGILQYIITSKLTPKSNKS